MSLKVYALRLGTAKAYESELFAYSLLDGEQDTMRNYDINAYLITTEERRILVDTGFNDVAYVSESGIDNYCTVTEALAKIHYKPEDITDVVISHAHWANIGGLESFLKARVWITKAELDAMDIAAQKGQTLALGYRWKDMQVLGMVSKLHIINRCRAISEVLRLDRVSGHTPGILCAGVIYNGRTILSLLTDNAWFYDNLEGRSLSVAWRDGGCDSLPRIRARAGASVLVPGRDPLLYKKYPAEAPGVARLFPLDK